MNAQNDYVLGDRSPIDEAGIRAYRQERLRSGLEAADVAVLVLFDPINLRYATGSRNMQVWTMHNFCRYAFMAAAGPCVMFEVPAARHLCEGLETVQEVRPAWSADYLVVADRADEIAGKWAAELREFVTEHGGGNRRVAIDRLDWPLARALERERLEIVDAKGICERARSIKSVEEIRALKHSLLTCEAAVAEMRTAALPGVTEQEALAVLIAGSIKRGGEYPETRLLTSGPRTNPWFQETTDRTLEAGDFIAFDTDLIGPMGFYNDISRTWVIGDEQASDRQRRLYALSRAQLETNISLLAPGVHLLEYAEQAYVLPDEYLANRYADVGHGCGLAVEYPFLWYPEDAEFGAYDGLLEENMVVCIESYVGAAGGYDGVKLEQPVWITRDGPVGLSEYPLEDAYA